MLESKRVVVTGGTGSLGNALIRRLLDGEVGSPESVTVFSRDEAKQQSMRLYFMHLRAATDDVIYQTRLERLRFHIGDVADERAITSVLREADVVFHAAALKQVPSCEYFPFQAVKTNVMGAENIVRAIREHDLPVESVIAVSTDKACKPVNVMGMTKAIQERIFVEGNLECPGTRFVMARYGNVLASRGSVLPVFHDQIRRGGPLTLTSPDMTRFLMTLDRAVDTILAAAEDARAGEVYIPRLPSARMIDVAEVLIGQRPVDIAVMGIRPGEKVHEILVSEEEAHRTFDRGDHFVIRPMLTELRDVADDGPPLNREYSSAESLLGKDEVTELLRASSMMVENDPAFAGPLAP